MINKPWGYEKILENSEYLFKLLFMRAGERCSLQHHEYKKETIYVITGLLKIIIDNIEYIKKPNDYITIQPKQIHRMEAITDTQYLEASTPYPNDVIRHKDDYGRT